MKQKYDFLPRRLKKQEIALAPTSWINTLSNYSIYRRKAIKEDPPAYYTLLTILMVAIVKYDRDLINVATNLTKDNVPRYTYLAFVGLALCDFNSKEKGLAMLRESAELKPLSSTLLSLAAETDDLDEKESLAKRILDENPKDIDALQHMAYAKYFKGEHQQAESLIDEILENEPYNVYTLEYKGNIYFDKQAYNEALEQYQKINLNPMPISLQFKICHCYYLLGVIREAKKIAKKIQDKISLTYDLGMDIESANKLLTGILNS